VHQQAWPTITSYYKASMLRVYRLLPDTHYRVGALPTAALHYVHDRTTLHRPYNLSQRLA